MSLQFLRLLKSPSNRLARALPTLGSPAICLSGELHWHAHTREAGRELVAKGKGSGAPPDAGEEAREGEVWAGWRDARRGRDPGSGRPERDARRAEMQTLRRLPAPPGGQWGRAGSRNNASDRAGRGQPGSPASPGHSAAHRPEPPPLASSSLFPRLLTAEGV
ncbi:unnamed protein product [Rangifer tarandus platyrhynchus]|uniref:Uncharacterized protein n=1 Tax=Rangifer tarandus platyrhynchus TaxID=3082113 RepID=A0ABN8Y557_RANTA|nr:unnamed protein product [Rangifer tarandus platyrhynchus]